MFDLFDTVRVVSADNKLIKEGVIVRLTVAGAHVYQPKQEPPFTDSVEFAEWFPFTSKEVRMILKKKYNPEEV